MPLNPAIALEVPTLQLPDPVTRYGRVMAMQSAAQQNALAQRQMQQAEQQAEQQNRLREFLPTLTPENRNQLLQYGESGRQAYESLLKGEKETREGEKAATEMAASRMKQARDLLPSVNSPEAYANWRNYTLQQLPGLSNIIPQQYSPEVTRNLMLEADKALEQHFVSQNLGGKERVVAMPKYAQGPAQVVPGSEAQKTMAPGEAERINIDRQRLDLEGRRVGLAEQAARQAADPVFQQRMAAARATGEAIAKGDLAAQQALPKIIDTAELNLRVIDQMIGQRDVKGNLVRKSEPHPGFKSAVGMGSLGTLGIPGLAQITPGTDAANFKTLFDQIGGAAFLEAYESLRGGGAITKDEGVKATAARNRMSLAQSEDEFVRAALEYRNLLEKGVRRAEAKAKQATGRAIPAAPVGGGVTFLGFEE